MKTFKFTLLAVVFFFSLLHYATANVTVTAATGGGSLTPCNYSTLGDIVIQEGNNSDIHSNQTNVTIILTAPPGYEFNAGVGTATCLAGRDVTINGIVVTTSLITVTFTSDASANAKDKITISGIQAKASNVTPLAASGNILRIVAKPGTAVIAGIVNGTTNFGSFTQAPNLTYSSSAVTQTNTTKVDAYSLYNQIIGIQVVVSGCGGTLNATSFTLNTNGSTNPASDIDTARLYYTGTSSTFAASTLFGKYTLPNGNFTITGNTSLSQGTNYFWLTYDCLGSINNDNLDGQCTSVKVGGITYTPSPTTVAGARLVFQHCPGGYRDAGSTIILNGTFDILPGQAGSGFASNYTYVPNVAPDPALSGTECWPEETYSVTNIPGNVHSNWSRTTRGIGGTGNFMVVNGAPVDNVTIWSEDNLACKPNIVYYFSTWVCSVHPANPAQLRFSINGVQQGSEFSPPADTANNWVQYYTTWNSAANSQVNLSIVNKNIIANGNDFGLDDIYMCPCMQQDLPVSLLYFNAKAINENEIDIDWSTASETDNDYFTVEKAYKPEDLDLFAIVKGAGNSNSKIDYDTKDFKGFEGHPVCYYRLKQTDFNGKFKYSQIISVDNNKQQPNMTAYNNNGNIILNITQSQSGQAEISVYDMLGQVLYKTEKFIQEGNNSYNLNTSKRNKSLYFVMMRDIESGKETVIKGY